ncbi:autotransporter, partial [Pseudomonas syringae pv. actinidiae ICMP 19101]
GAKWGQLGLRLGAVRTWHELTAKRTLDLPGSSEHFKEDYKAATNQVFGELGYALENKSQDNHITFSTLGLRAATHLNAGGVAIKPNATLGWRRAYGDVTPESRAAFSG